MQNFTAIPPARPGCGDHMRAPLNGLSETIFPMWPLADDREPPPRVDWMKKAPLSFVGAWEPLSFRIRSGYAYTDEADFVRDREFSDKALDGYINAGANSIIIPFSKGFGLDHTAEELAQEADLSRRCHKKNLKVGAYIRVDALVPELMKRDEPDVEDWLTTGVYGRQSVYSAQQTFRKRICYLHPGAVKWLERLLMVAIERLSADVLHLDGFAVSYLPWETCRCGRCLAAYRRWLKFRFPDDAQRQRMFGLIDFDETDFPHFEPHAKLPTVTSAPDWQAWYQFQWEKQLAFMRHIRHFVRSRSAHVAITANPGWTRTTHGPPAMVPVD